MGWVVGAEPGAMGSIHFTKGLEWQTIVIGPWNLAFVQGLVVSLRNISLRVT